MTIENSNEGGQHGMTLLLHGGKITADTAKYRGSRRTAKRARNLLLHFGHPKISFGQIVAKRKSQIVEEGQDLIGTPQQSIQQVFGLALFPPAFAPFCGRRCRRLRCISGCQDLKIPGNPFITLQRRQAGVLTLTPLLTGFMQIKQKIVHLGGPGLLFLLSDSGTVSQQMGSTQAMSAPIRIIACQAVMHASACKTRPDANLIHGWLATRLMPRQVSQIPGAVDMQPMKHSIDANARLISMLKRTCNQELGNTLHRGSQPLGGHCCPLDQRGFRDLASAECRKRFTGTSRWQQLPLIQIHGQRLQIGTILHGCFDRGRKASLVSFLSVWTPDGFDLMLLSSQADFWHIEDLTAFDHGPCKRAQILPTLGADFRTMLKHFLCWFYHQEGMPRVSRLSAWTLFTWRSRTAWWTRQPIGRGRLATRTTVFCQSIFQLLDPSIRLGQLLFQGEQLRYQRFEESVFFPKGLQFFIVRHTATVACFLSFGKSTRS